MKRIRIICVALVICFCATTFPIYIVDAADELYNTVLKNNNDLRGRNSDPNECLDFSADEAISTMAYLITFQATSDYEKIQTIYNWVVNNIYYDFDYFNGKKKTTSIDASDVYTSKVTICEGYANLTMELLRSIGIPCIKVQGYALGIGEKGYWTTTVINSSQTNHAWNEAYADGRWIILDTTWDSGNRYENGQYYINPSRTNYFDISDAAFAKDHFIVKRESTVPINEIKTEGDFTYYTDGSGATIIGWKHEDYKAKYLSIPSSLGGCPVVAIADNTFEDARLLGLSFPNTLKTIGYQAFYGAYLTGKVYIPASVKNIGTYAFSYMYGVTAFEVPSSNTAYCSIDGVLFDKEIKTLYNYPIGSTKVDYVLPESVEHMFCTSFGNALSLKNLVVRNTKTNCATYTFYGCDLIIYGKSGSVMQDLIGKGYLSGKLRFKNINEYKGLIDTTVITPSTGKLESVTALASDCSVLVNGRPVSFQAYNIKDNNYFKLRDIAYVLNGTGKCFEVRWDEVKNAISLMSGWAYSAVGGELTFSGNATAISAVPTTSDIYLDGLKISLTAYNINGNNYFKLRDIANAIDFGVMWDELSNSISIDTSIKYTP
ncbi:MAG: transglutaminase domain-containing protein [Eubacteriales bacterium]